MACFPLKCLKILVFINAIFICGFAGIGSIIVGALYYKEPLAVALKLEGLLLGLALTLGFIVIIFSFLGIWGAFKVKRCCLTGYFIFLIPVFIFSLSLLGIFIDLAVKGEDQLRNYCNKESNHMNSSSFRKLEAYDDII